MNSGVDQENAFILVSGKRKAGKSRPRGGQVGASLQTSNCDKETFDVDGFRARLNSCIQEIETSTFFQTSLDIINSVVSMKLQNRAKKRTELSVCEPVETASCDSNGENTDSASSICLAYSFSRSAHQNEVSPHLSDTPGTDASFCPETGFVQQQKHSDVHLLSYGIGNFTSCLISRYQLAFLLALRSKLSNSFSKTDIYDPVFSESEKLILNQLECHVISDNEEGKRACSQPTLAFLPHCGKALYNNLLWRNLATPGFEGLSNLVLIGNSFSNILERTPKRILNKTGGYIIKLSPYMKEIVLPNIFPHEDIFNDLAIHYFPQSQLVEAAQSLLDLSEPVYDDDEAELIKR